MKKKIILGVTKSNFGGAQRYCFDVATSLGPEYDVLVVFGGHGILEQKLTKRGIRTFSIPSLERDLFLWKEIRSFVSLLSLFLSEKPDIIHLNSPKIGGLGALAGRIVRVPKIVYTAHGFSFQENRSFVWKFAAYFFSWATVLLAHATIVVSKNDYHLGRGFPFSRKKIVLVHNGISAKQEMFPRNEARRCLTDGNAILHEHDVWVGSIGELHPNKNFPAAILAVAKYNESAPQKIRYVIVGDGEEKEKLRLCVQHLGAENDIFFVSLPEGASQILLAFDAFLIPSQKEGLPYVLLEAGLAGLPVIGTPVGGIPDVIEQRKTGLLSENTSAKAIETSLTEAIERKNEAKQWGENIKTRILSDFLFEKTLLKTKDVYGSER